MKALVYRRSVPRFALQKLVGNPLGKLRSSQIAPLAICDIPEPPLPTQHWVRIAPRLTGVCGSDLATICATGSPYLAPLTSLPFVMGHELVGDIVEVGPEVRQCRVGDRVVLHPALGCVARGIAPLCDACAGERDALCRNVTRGDVSAGIQVGFCRDTGGGFSASLVAHETQVHQVPEEVPDEAAVLIEPFACALHGALRVQLSRLDTALVIGCGSIGLLTIAALRASGCKARIVAVAKYDHQSELALKLGADELLPARGSLADRYATWASALNAEVYKPELGKPAVVGGADATFDCVASSGSIDDSLRFTRSGGTCVLVGMPGIPKGVDWTPLWFKELSVLGAYAYGPESTPQGTRTTFELAIDLMRDWHERLETLVSKPFKLKDYRSALASALNTGQSHAVKTVFRITDEGA